MCKFVDDLVANGMAYPNPKSRWAGAPLLVLKPEALLQFTVDLKPVNIFTIKHQYSMPNMVHELSELKDAVFFDNFHMYHGYWKLLVFPLMTGMPALHYNGWRVHAKKGTEWNHL